jgi:hypothetical protein
MLTQMQRQKDRARFTLDATGTPVIAKVIDRSAEGYLVAQALPFLKLQSGIWDADGRRGRIAGVAVSVTDNTPSLVLEVVYDVHADDTQPIRRARRDDTIEFERPSDAPPRVISVSDPPPALPSAEEASPAFTKPAWLARLDAWLEPRIARLAARLRPA